MVPEANQNNLFQNYVTLAFSYFMPDTSICWAADLFPSSLLGLSSTILDRVQDDCRFMLFYYCLRWAIVCLLFLKLEFGYL